MNASNMHFGPLGASGDTNVAQTGMFDKMLDNNKFEKKTEVAAFNEALGTVLVGVSGLNQNQYPVGNMNRDNH